MFDNVTADVIRFVEKKVASIIRNSGLSFFYRSAKVQKLSAELEDNILWNVFKSENLKLSSIDEAQNYIIVLCEEIESLDFVRISDVLQTKNIGTKYSSEEEFQKDMADLVKELQMILSKVSILGDLNFYEKKKILKTLSTEFCRQISPVKYPEYVSEIKLENQNDLFELRIDNKSKDIDSNGYFGFEDITNVVFIDDITILDSVNPQFGKHYRDYRNYFFGEFGSDSAAAIFALDHKFDLINKLSVYKNIVENFLDDISLREINDEISSIMSQEIIIKDDAFVCSEDGLFLANLAMGSKMFAIIKMLISNGAINSKSLLILDEPESHLHPSWQNKLAELIVALVKKLGLKVVITSHSPNFILALNTYSVKHGIIENTDFYSTKTRDDGYFVDYFSMNDDLTGVYAELSRPFSEIKAIFDSLK